ncbi:hypothetical protein QTP88_000538 [Uroleucon formosanum]
MPPKNVCQKRKERAQKDAELKKLRGSFDRFLPNKDVNSSIVLIALENGGQENVGDILQTENSENAIGHFTILVKSTANSASEITSLESSVQENINEIVQTENTIGHLCNSNDSACPDSNVKRLILAYGSCRPTIQFPYTEHENGKSYHFSKHYYFMKLKSGLSVPRKWPCYSVGLDVVYCETCWLFANRGYSYFNPSWVNGVNNWHCLSAKIDLHEKSIQHIDAIKVRCIWEKNETIDKLTEQQYSNEAAYWRNVLKRIIKIILFLTSGNTALRGHEHKGKFNEHEYINEGNFMRSVKLLAEFDPVMNELLNDEKKKSNILAGNIILRYTILNFDERSLSIEESFLGLYAIDKHGAKDYEDLIISILKALNINISKCRGQGYDGASVMSRLYSGVQKRIKDQVPLAQYVHCCAHNLNLVISDAAKSSKQVTSFFETVQSIFNFFSSSAPRWSILAFGEADAKKIKAKVLKKFIDVLKALTNISLTSSKTDEKISSKKDTNLHNACENLKQATSTIKELRNNYHTLMETAKCMCTKWGIPQEFHVHRLKFGRRYFDEVDGDRRLDISEDNLRIKVFPPVINTVIFQLDNRFQGLKKVIEYFDFLNSFSLINSTEDDIIKASYDFVNFYNVDISSDFTRQLLCIKNLINLKITKIIKQLAMFIIENDFCTTYSEVLSACIIYLTLPVTVASAERTFSKLKLIKNYLRNSMGQNRLSNIALLNIEKEQDNILDMDKIINQFAETKARKVNILS